MEQPHKAGLRARTGVASTVLMELRVQKFLSVATIRCINSQLKLINSACCSNKILWVRGLVYVCATREGR